VPGNEQGGVVGHKSVAGGATVDLGGARLRRAVGRNWLRDALARRLSSRTSARLFGDVLQANLTAETPGEGEEVPRLKRWCTYLRARGSRGSSARRSRGVRAAPTLD
jgi:hypothetical protein